MKNYFGARTKRKGFFLICGASSVSAFASSVIFCVFSDLLLDIALHGHFEAVNVEAEEDGGSL